MYPIALIVALVVAPLGLWAFAGISRDVDDHTLRVRVWQVLIIADLLLLAWLVIDFAVKANA